MIGETNINGGAGLNGKGALLKIKAPTGSIITVSKDSYSETIKVSQLDPDDNNWSYWIFQTTDFGEWIATAIRQPDQATESKTVTISENKKYDLEILFRFYLFRNGYGLTSGYSISYSTNGGSGAGGSTNWDRINLTYNASFAIKPSVDITDYTLLCFNVASLYLDAQNRCRIALSTDGAVWNGTVSHSAANQYMNNTGVISLDISAYSGSYYAAGVCGGNSWINISDIYLSR